MSDDLGAENPTEVEGGGLTRRRLLDAGAVGVAAAVLDHGVQRQPIGKVLVAAVGEHIAAPVLYRCDGLSRGVGNRLRFIRLQRRLWFPDFAL